MLGSPEFSRDCMQVAITREVRDAGHNLPHVDLA